MPRWLVLGVVIPVGLALLAATRKLWAVPIGEAFSTFGRAHLGISLWEKFEDAFQAWVLQVFKGMDKDDAIRTVKAKRDLNFGRRRRR